MVLPSSTIFKRLMCLVCVCVRSEPVLLCPALVFIRPLLCLLDYSLALFMLLTVIRLHNDFNSGSPFFYKTKVKSMLQWMKSDSLGRYEVNRTWGLLPSKMIHILYILCYSQQVCIEEFGSLMGPTHQNQTQNQHAQHHILDQSHFLNTWLTLALTNFFSCVL